MEQPALTPPALKEKVPKKKKLKQTPQYTPCFNKRGERILHHIKIQTLEDYFEKKGGDGEFGSRGMGNKGSEMQEASDAQ
jgi:hypothetical protein